MRKHRNFLAFLLSFACALHLHATLGVPLQMQLGNPSGAASDPGNHARYLIQRAQYAMDYSDNQREPNWVAWNLTTTDVGGSGRSDFVVDPTLPAGFTPVLTTDYSGSGYDRGHMCPSGDRTVSVADNQVTFYMSNMVPQAPDNNQGVWANFESYCRTLAAAGNEILIITGPSGFAGSSLVTGVAIPGYVWKVAVIVPLGAGSAVSRITTATRVIAIKVPNIQGVRSDPWQNYVTSAAQIEADTGYTFFSELPAVTANALRTKIDGQTVVGAPSIVTQPETQGAGVGGTLQFTVVATGDAPLSYQWLKDDVELPGATSATLTVANLQGADAGNYFVVVSNAVGSATSNIASLIVTGLAPSILAPPASQSVPAGGNATFTVGVSGSPTLSYQWRKNTNPIAGATLSTLALADVQSGDAAAYDVVVTNSVDSATSAAATLTVTPAGPSILVHPAAQTVTGGTVVTLNVVARGSAPLGYQWRKGGVPLANGGVVSGADTAALRLAGVSADDAGSYDVVVSNAISTATSNSAALVVNAATIVWTFGPDLANATASPTSGLPVDLTGGAVTQGNNNGTTPLLTTTSASPTGSGFSGTVNAGAAARVGPFSAALSAYFEFTLQPEAGEKLVVSGVTFGSRRTSTGPQAYSIFTSFDNYATPVATGALGADSVWAVIAPAAFTAVTGTSGAPITVRIYGHNGSGSPGVNTANWRIDDLKVKVSTLAASAAVAPEVVSTIPAHGANGVAVASPISVTFNQPVIINGPWFTIASAATGPVAATVTGGPTTYTLTPPASFAFGDTVTVTILAGQVIEKDTGTLALAANHVFSFHTGLPVAPAITGQPQPRTVSDGTAASFSVTATGTAPLTYQWRKGGTAILGSASATTPTLTFSPATLADAGDYDCVVTNPAGFAVSDPVKLTVLAVGPAITQHPAPLTVALGGSAFFAVQATGSAPLAYTWRRDGVALADGPGISGSATAQLALSGVQAGSAGTYDVVVANGVDSLASQPATLGVTSAALGAIVWDFATASPSSGLPPTLGGGALTQGNNNGTTALLTTTSASPTGSGFSGGNNAGAAARTGALNPATSAYFEFTLTPAAGRQLVATGLSFGARSTGTGPQAYAVFTSVDGFAQPVAAGALLANSSWALHAPAFAGVRGAAGAPVTFRIFGYNGTGSPGINTANWRIDDLKLIAGTELPPAVIATAPAADAKDVELGAPITVTFNQPVGPSGAWYAIHSATRGAVAASVSGGPAIFTLTPAGGWTYGESITVTIAAGHVVDETGTLHPPADHVFSFTTAAPIAPSIVASPASLTATVNDTVSFQVTAAGTGPLGYQWRKDGAALAGNASATTDTLILPTIATADAGDYECVVTNVAGSATSAAATLTVNKAVATISLGDLAPRYDGQPKVPTVLTHPAGLAVQLTYDGGGTPPVNAGTYQVIATIDDANYNGSAGGALVIAPAQASLVLEGLRQPYDGTARVVRAVTQPAGLEVAITYDGALEPPVMPGHFAVVATIAERNYTGGASDTLIVTTTALVRHAPVIHGGVDGSVQMLLPEDVTLNGAAWLSGDLLVPGMPVLAASGKSAYVGFKFGPGAATPANYRVVLSGVSLLRYLVRRVDPVPVPVVDAPVSPPGDRDVVLHAETESIGDLATLRDLTLAGDAGLRPVPAGAYGAFAASANSGFILGDPAGGTPAVYHLESLALHGDARLVLVGPVVIHLANGAVLGGTVDSAGRPDWLTLNVFAGPVTLNGKVHLTARVVAPNSTVTLNAATGLTGEVISDRLVVGGNAHVTAAPAP